MNQMSFSDLSYRTKKKQTRRELFLEEKGAVLPWEMLLKLIERKYPKSDNGRRPIGAEVMLRIYSMQQWYGLSDPGMEDRLYDAVEVFATGVRTSLRGMAIRFESNAALSVRYGSVASRTPI